MTDALAAELKGLGVFVQPQWLTACAAHLEAAAPGFGGSSTSHKAKMVLQQLLHCDLNECGAGALPLGALAQRDGVVAGKFLLQVDEVVNIGAAVRDRYSGNDGSSRCLKLLLTDGMQQMAAIEYRPTPALHSAMPAGSKLMVHNAAVRRGILLLTPQCCGVLGGQVARLEAARQRMVVHWTQPAVGRRGPPPTMQQAVAEASRAAWTEGIAPDAPGAAPHANQQHAAQGPTANPQLPPRPSQQATQLLSQQQQQQQQQSGRLAESRAQIPPAARVPARPGAAQAQLQQQPPRATANLHRPSGGVTNAGSATVQQQQQQQQPSRPEQHQNQQPPWPQQQLPQQQLSRGVAGQPHHARQQAAAAPPLQERNGDAAPSGGIKRSRLALPKPPSQEQEPPPLPAAAADFSFAEPLQQQESGQSALPRLQPRPPAQLLQHLRRAVGADGGAGADSGLAAGTADDPICLSDDDQQQLAANGSLAAEGDVEMSEAAQEPGSWVAADASDYGDEPPAGPQLDPWEQGWDADEQQGAHWPVDELEKRLPDAEAEEDQHGGSSELLQAGEEAGTWQEDDQAPVAAAGAGAGDAGNSNDGWEDEEAEGEQQQQPPVCHTQQRPAEAPPQRQGSSGEAQLAAAPLGTGAQLSSHAHHTSSNLKVQPASRGRPESISTRQQQEQQLPAGAECQLEPPDPSLLAAAPSLTEVLFSKQSAAQVTPPAPAPAARNGRTAAGAGPADGTGGSPRATLIAAPTPQSSADLGKPTASASSPTLAGMPSLQHFASSGQRPRTGRQVVAESDDDLPSFDLLPEISPDRRQQQGAPAPNSSDEPFAYLLQLKQRAATAGAFPVTATIFATLKQLVGRLQLRDSQRQPQYGMQLEVEDGSMVANAQLSPQFVQDFFGMEPQQFEADLADPSKRQQAAQLAGQLQTMLASYTGLMLVRLESADAPLEVMDLKGEMSAEQVVALQRRATSAM